MGGGHGGIVVSTVASQQEGRGFESRLGPFCAEFACSPRVRVGLLRVLRFPPTLKDMHVRCTPAGALDQGTGLRTGVGPQALHCGCPLLLRMGQMQRTNYPTG